VPALLLCLCGCGPTILSGTVTDKNHIPAHRDTILVPMTMGDTTTLIPMTVDEPEKFQITFVGEDKNGKQRTRTTYVTGDTYFAAKVGERIELDR
jgi:hypothetical protein